MAYRILVIDDNQDILDLFQALFADEAYEVISSDFIEASTIAQLQPDLLILDYMVGLKPVGGRIVQALKQHPDTAHLPVIMCTTANVTKLEQDPTLTLEDVAVVLKPFDVPSLFQTVEDALGKTRNV